MSKIYTKTGDQGTTCLVSGETVEKNHIRLDSYGTLDELNSHIGLCRCLLKSELKEEHIKTIDPLFFEIQNDLFNLGSQLANTNPQLKEQLPNINSQDILKLEIKIDELSEKLPPLKNFILPGGTQSSAQLHIARTVCRRAERKIIELKNQNPEKMDPLCIQYINRLSDLLFVVARYANSTQLITDIEWKK